MSSLLPPSLRHTGALSSAPRPLASKSGASPTVYDFKGGRVRCRKQKSGYSEQKETMQEMRQYKAIARARGVDRRLGPEGQAWTCEVRRTLPRLLVLLPPPQLPPDARKLETDRQRCGTRPVPFALLTSQWSKKSAPASLPQLRSCACKLVAEPK